MVSRIDERRLGFYHGAVYISISGLLSLYITDLEHNLPHIFHEA